MLRVVCCLLRGVFVRCTVSVGPGLLCVVRCRLFVVVRSVLLVDWCVLCVCCLLCDVCGAVCGVVCCVMFHDGCVCVVCCVEFVV